MSSSEGGIVNTILRKFGSLPYMRIFRMNTGVFLTQDGCRTVRCGVKGQADIGGILDMRQSAAWDGDEAVAGVRLEIETKMQKGRQSEAQMRYQEMIERFGGIYILARTEQDVTSKLEELGFLV